MSETSPAKNRPNIISGILARFAQIAIMFLVQAAILFLAAGTIHWVWAWVFLCISVASVLINSLFLMRTNPEIVAERGRPKEVKDWDKTVSGLWGLVQYLLIPLVAGLDVRFGWTGGVSLAWHLAGALVFAAGLGLFSWAMITNAYFSTAARIQSDRGQTVCRTGPYRFVRHPGYVGAIHQSLGTPLLLGSLWALIPAITAAVLMIIRTSLEDSMLQAELPGYTDFARDVRYRLVPGIW
jgi:protein-S-isoprenylcysteine O-methyltransferase Ste14